MTEVDGGPGPGPGSVRDHIERASANALRLGKREGSREAAVKVAGMIMERDEEIATQARVIGELREQVGELSLRNRELVAENNKLRGPTNLDESRSKPNGSNGHAR